MDFFKQLTTTNLTGEIPEKQNVVIMGKNTYLSLPNKILPNRINIVISSSYDLWKDKSHPDIIVVPDFKNALHYCDIHEFKNIYVIGGAKLYKEALGSNSLDNIYKNSIAAKNINNISQKDFEKLDGLAARLVRSENPFGPKTAVIDEGQEYVFG